MQMPCNHRRKTVTKYSLEDLKKAIDDVQIIKLTIGKAAETYDVPKTAISDHHHLKMPVIKLPRAGRKILFTDEQEAELQFALYAQERLPVKDRAPLFPVSLPSEYEKSGHSGILALDALIRCSVYMPRNFKRRTVTKYSLEGLKKAIDDVQTNKLTIGKAAETYNVPKTTIFDHLKMPVIKLPRAGRKILFTDEQETELVDYIIKYNQLHYGLTIKKFTELRTNMLSRTRFLTISTE
ncbi:hypothetical protein HHI36_013632 [Cryptolaemus montrouzieri]|uniref:HTH psq-type domain-containing protein n=1 Tax=Cryptolaemus montrouzieri TaxID=559131 RepID=A0ABD2NID6_9CUCU